MQKAAAVVPKMLRWFEQSVSPEWGRRIRYRLPSSLTSTVADVQYHGAVFRVNTGELMGMRMFYQGRHEPSSERAFLSLIKPDDVFFDIGANLGVYSILAAQAGARVHAFEPSARVRALLETNVRVNHLAQRIEIHPWALSDTDGTVAFREGRAGNWGVGKIFDFGKSTDGTESYPVATMMYETARQRLGTPNVVKMDTEGAEWLIAQGLSQTRPADTAATTFLVEVHPREIQALGGSVDRLIERFKRLGLTKYSLVDEDRDGGHVSLVFSAQPVASSHFAPN